MVRLTTILFAAMFCATLLAMPSAVSAVDSVTHWVATHGTVHGTGTSCTDPGYVGSNQEPITAALTAAATGDVVVICAGRYLYENDGFNAALADDVTIIGEGIGKTILDGDDNYYLLAIEGGSNLSLQGISFVHGSDTYGGGLYIYDSVIAVDSCEFSENTTSHSGADYGGAGVYVADDSTVTITRSRFRDNIAPSDSAGAAINIYTSGGSEAHVSVSRSSFIGNQAGQGPAIYLFDQNEWAGDPSTLNVNNNSFINNVNTNPDEGNADGGAIAFEHTNAQLVMTNNVFRENSGAYSGGAVEIWDVNGSITVERNTFSRNSAGEGGAMWIDVRNGIETIRRNRFIGNTADVGGAIAFECEVSSARQTIRGLRLRNTFFSNRAAVRRTSDVVASDYGCVW
jgi:hypothetical protein